MPIVAGECEFTTPRPFEARSARVKLSFTVDPGENVDKVIAETGTTARTYAYAMINGSEIVQHAPVEAPRTRAPRAVPPPQPATVGADSGTVAEVPATSDPFAGGAPASSAQASAPVSDIALKQAPPTPVAEITDAMLQDALKAKVAADPKHTPGAMALVREFTANPLANIYTVTDQGKRAEFLSRLAAL